MIRSPRCHIPSHLPTPTRPEPAAMARPGPGNNNPHGGNNQPPISFKTVPGRNRTQKWQQAKTVDYGGDDWGGYDAYDDYSDPPVATGPPSGSQYPPPSQQNYYPPGGAHAPSSSQQRPYSPQRGPPRRMNSFDQNDDRRAFGPAPGHGGFSSPEHIPPPLHPRASPSPTHGVPRKSSKASLADDTSSNASDKPLPFIRPSDIYKRMAEARASEEGSRPSMDSLQRDPPTGTLGSPAPLAAVKEARESRLFEEEEKAKRESVTSGEKLASPQLPLVRGVSDFDTGFLGEKSAADTTHAAAAAAAATAAATTAAPLTSTTTSTEPLAASSSAEPAGELHHNPSRGFRSAVHQAFDKPAVPSLSIRSTGGQSTASGATNTSGVGRSDTTSTGTSNISPILSHVPPAAAATLAPTHSVKRKPSPAAKVVTPGSGAPAVPDAQVAAAAPAVAATAAAAAAPVYSSSTTKSSEDTKPAGFEPGYRRSLDPPSNGSTPSHQPVLEYVDDATARKRLSDGVQAEIESAAVEPASTTTTTGTSTSPVDPADAILPLSLRIGSDLSAREADLAGAVNSAAAASPHTDRLPAPTTGIAGEAVRASRHLFLDAHPGTPPLPGGTPAQRISFTPSVLPASDDDAGKGGGKAGEQRSRSTSPTKSRVRDLADKFAEIESRSRRGSDASSTKEGKRDESTPPSSVVPAAAAGVGVGVLGAAAAGVGLLASTVNPAARPATAAKEPSFQKPEMPGGWVSAAPTPASEVADAPFGSPGSASSSAGGKRISKALPPPPPGLQKDDEDEVDDWERDDDDDDDEKVDLTPRSKSTSSAHPSSSALDAAKAAGTQLGAALLSSVGLGHQTRDFASADPAPAVDQPELQPAPRPRGEILPQHATRAAPLRLESDDTLASNASVASTTTVGAGGEDAVAPLRVSGIHNRNSRIEPLGGGGLPAAAAAEPSSATSADTISPVRTVSSSGGEEGESERLRREIERSLDPEYLHSAGSSAGISAGPSAAMQAQQRSSSAEAAAAIARHIQGNQGSSNVANTTTTRPGLLDQRFSWEDRPAGLRTSLLPGGQKADAEDPAAAAAATEEQPAPTLDTTIPVVPPSREGVESPEIKPEAAYERPRNKALGVVNATVVGSPVTESVDPATELAEPKATVADSAPTTGADHLSPATAFAAAGAATGAAAGAVALAAGCGPVTPTLNRSQENLDVNRGTELTAPSPIISDHGSSTRLPSYYWSETAAQEDGNFADGAAQAQRESVVSAAGSGVRENVETEGALAGGAEENAEQAPAKTPAVTAPGTAASSSGPIPPFKTILAIPDTTTRIATYTSTRATFANMNTGLDDWIQGLMAARPELANLEPAPITAVPPAGSLGRRVGTGGMGHRQTPSLNIGKLATRFGGGGGSSSAADGLDDSPSAGNSSAHPNSAGAAGVYDGSPGGHGKVAGVDVDKMQQRGKDFMKSAGVLGGKAQAGAKGLLAKGRSRFAAAGGGLGTGGGGKV